MDEESKTLDDIIVENCNSTADSISFSTMTEEEWGWILDSLIRDEEVAQE